MTTTDTRTIAAERGTGRTTALIHWAAEEQPAPAPMRYIVCHSQRECRRVADRAQDLGVRIAFPVTWDEMLRMRGLSRRVEFAIDNLSLILAPMVPGSIGPVTW